ncbi:hypothetical protein ABZY57_04525 [Streptomyces sp. NPDC006450]|uniref:hypothetical protein n=1 Tax=Streptomyces sp. NPDC006450 TaxID=3155458 RepID=UPI0033A0CA04
MNTALALAWAALPEFLGSLGAGLVLTIGAWIARRRASSRPAEQEEDRITG